MAEVQSPQMTLGRCGAECRHFSKGLRGRELDRLAHQNPAVKELVGRYYSRQSQLHEDCFYLGLCEPMETTERRIRETAAYIDDAERLAEG